MKLVSVAGIIATPQLASYCFRLVNSDKLRFFLRLLRDYCFVAVSYDTAHKAFSLLISIMWLTLLSVFSWTSRFVSMLKDIWRRICVACNCICTITILKFSIFNCGNHWVPFLRIFDLCSYRIFVVNCNESICWGKTTLVDGSRFAKNPKRYLNDRPFMTISPSHVRQEFALLLFIIHGR